MQSAGSIKPNTRHRVRRPREPDSLLRFSDFFCVTQNLKTSVLRWVFSTSSGALCRMSSLVAGLMSAERTSATPRSVFQISDRHLR